MGGDVGSRVVAGQLRSAPVQLYGGSCDCGRWPDWRFSSLAAGGSGRNLLIGTLDGLNLLSPHKVTSIVNVGLVNSVGVSPDGGMWVGLAGGLIEFRGDQRWDQKSSRYYADAPWPSMSTSMAISGHRLEATCRRGEASNRGFVELAGLEALSQIRLIASDKHGGCWLYDLDHGLFHWKDGLLEVPPLPPSYAVLERSRGTWDWGARLWLSLTDGRLATIDHDGTILVRGLGRRCRGCIAPCTRTTLERCGLGALAASRVFKMASSSTLRRTDAFPADSVAGIVDDVSGALWLGTGSGIIRILRDDFDCAVTNQTTWIRHSFYDTSDGLAGTLDRSASELPPAPVTGASGS